MQRLVAGPRDRLRIARSPRQRPLPRNRRLAKVERTAKADRGMRRRHRVEGGEDQPSEGLIHSPSQRNATPCPRAEQVILIVRWERGEAARVSRKKSAQRVIEHGQEECDLSVQSWIAGRESLDDHLLEGDIRISGFVSGRHDPAAKCRERRPLG